MHNEVREGAGGRKMDSMILRLINTYKADRIESIATSIVKMSVF